MIAGSSQVDPGVGATNRRTRDKAGPAGTESGRGQLEISVTAQAIASNVPIAPDSSHCQKDFKKCKWNWQVGNFMAL